MTKYTLEDDLDLNILKERLIFTIITYQLMRDFNKRESVL